MNGGTGQPRATEGNDTENGWHGLAWETQLRAMNEGKGGLPTQQAMVETTEEVLTGLGRILKGRVGQGCIPKGRNNMCKGLKVLGLFEEIRAASTTEIRPRE